MKTLLLLALLALGNTNTDKQVVEVVDATVEDNEGNATDTQGYYIKYDKSRFKKGDNARTVLVYNPCTNYVDDVVYRIDVEVK